MGFYTDDEIGYYTERTVKRIFELGGIEKKLALELTMMPDFIDKGAVELRRRDIKKHLLFVERMNLINQRLFKYLTGCTWIEHSGVSQ